MREIKFRQRIDNQFHYWGFIDGKFISPADSTTGANPVNTEHDIYSGLKDKKGKDIYKNDILRFDWFGSEFSYSKVVFENASFGMYWINPILDEDKDFKAFWNTDAGDFDWDLDNAEIIGNIYENPELAEGEK